jgi:hypothetical protein
MESLKSKGGTFLLGSVEVCAKAGGDAECAKSSTAPTIKPIATTGIKFLLLFMKSVLLLD